MKIGIDLRPLQNGHKYRGIGEVTKRVVNFVLQYGHEDGHEFIFYQYNVGNPQDLLDIPDGLKYSSLKVGDDTSLPTTERSNTNKILDTYNEILGEPIGKSDKSDVFLQFDYAAGVPKNTPTLLIKHDIIPYLFWNHYFESAWVPFKNKAARTTMRTIFANYKYKRILSRSIKNAKKIVTVSKSTKKDLEHYYGIDTNKITVAHLGVDLKTSKTGVKSKINSDIYDKPYVLFIGAGDARRRVDDAVAVYNNLRAKGNDIRLVLAGENFKSKETIPNPILRSAVLKSSYGEGIITLGYIDDETKYELYKNALAFVYPTKYEGFGIPILESMLLKCPVVVYDNSSTMEVGGKYAYYASNWEEMMLQVEKIMKMSKNELDLNKDEALKYAQNFTWEKTSKIIYKELINL